MLAVRSSLIVRFVTSRNRVPHRILDRGRYLAQGLASMGEDDDSVHVTWPQGTRVRCHSDGLMV